jgi:hypothetical protein
MGWVNIEKAPTISRRFYDILVKKGRSKYEINGNYLATTERAVY